MAAQRRDVRLTLEQSQLLNRARVLGQGRALPILLSDSELSKIAAVILSDLGHSELAKKFPALPSDSHGSYYQIDLGWFSQAENCEEFVAAYLSAVTSIRDFETYFACLCELHKRRRKFEMILAAQPVPRMLQVAPRALLEFGTLASPALASWMIWRKWFYDIDNRAAQETGYLFEPVLVAALGGVSFGARVSPIKRSSDMTKGRQVDCIVGRDAYEFKLRVTIAASGQGRFREELDFAKDCRESGYNPILLVLDPTPSTRLTDLKAEFERYGGGAFIGGEAWDHIDREAGPIMATFVERYVRKPIAEMDTFSKELLNFTASAAPDGSELRFEVGTGSEAHKWAIQRREDLPIPSDGDEENGA